MSDRYFLTDWSGEEREVTREAWVSAERNAGFRPVHAPDRGQPATAGWGTTAHGGSHGRIEYDPDPEQSEDWQEAMRMIRGEGMESG